MGLLPFLRYESRDQDPDLQKELKDIAYQVKAEKGPWTNEAEACS
ncbi:hypothetical protein TthTF19_17470 [Thermus thermophilus]